MIWIGSKCTGPPAELWFLCNFIFEAYLILVMVQNGDLNGDLSFILQVTVSKSHAVCSCKQFVMCGIVCRHAFCGLKQIGVTKFPRSLVLNRWMKVAESGTSLESNVVCSDYFKMEQVSLKLTNLWFDFRQILSKACLLYTSPSPRD